MTKDKPERHDAANGEGPAPDSRSFLGQAAAFLAGEAGLAQFLALGVGADPEGGIGDIAGEMRPRSRIVYADSDPAVLDRARSLLAGRPAGTTDFFEADLREPVSVLGRTADTLDFGLPIGVLMYAAAGTDPADEPGGPYRIVAALMNILPGGSYLAVTGRGEAEADRFVEGLSMAEPELVPVQEWCRDRSDDSAMWRVIVHKPS